MDTRPDSEQAQPLQLPNVFQIAIGSDREMVILAAQRFLRCEGHELLIKDIIFDEYERLLAQLDNTSSEATPANRFIEGIEEALNTVGLTIIACRRQQYRVCSSASATAMPKATSAWAATERAIDFA